MPNSCSALFGGDSSCPTKEPKSRRRQNAVTSKGATNNPVYRIVESGAARLMRMRTSLELLIEKAGGMLGAVIATKSAR
jgi:hypothetical protein